MADFLSILEPPNPVSEVTWFGYLLLCGRSPKEHLSYNRGLLPGVALCVDWRRLCSSYLRCVMRPWTESYGIEVIWRPNCLGWPKSWCSAGFINYIVRKQHPTVWWLREHPGNRHAERRGQEMLSRAVPGTSKMWFLLGLPTFMWVKEPTQPPGWGVTRPCRNMRDAESYDLFGKTECTTFCPVFPACIYPKRPFTLAIVSWMEELPNIDSVGNLGLCEL